MDLLLTLDENYLLPCRVMLDSFFTSNPGEENVSVYLLHSGIPGPAPHPVLPARAGGAGRLLLRFRCRVEAHGR